MNKLFTLMCLMAFVATTLFAVAPMNTNQVLQPTVGSRDEVVYWIEDFEEGLGDWTFVDETAPTDWTEEWHLSTVGAYSGNSWWMGDEAIGGYTNHRYVVLDTPEITLPTGTPELTFKLNYLMESIGGTTPYDAWDGANVRISTDGGETWTVITGTPTYSANSFYSFGYEFGEGPNVPGWGGTSNGWVDATFSLTDYAGQDVMIRFAFASDPSACTNDTGGDPSWFGVRVDDIDVAGVFQSDGDGAAGDSQMVPGVAGSISGDYWEISTAQAYSGTQSAHCPVQYSLLDAIVSPPVELPALDELYFAYYVYCDMLDSDGNDDNSLEDYFLVYVKDVDDADWTRLHYLFNGGTSGGVYTEWTLINQEFTSLNLGYQEPSGTSDISDFAGQTVQFKVVINTDDNDDGGIGEGTYFDDFMVYSPVFLPGPTEVTAEVNDDYDVELSWTNPMSGGGEGWVHWDDGVNNDGIGLTAAGVVEVAARFDASDLLNYVGSSITTIKFYPNEDTDYTLKIWEGGQTEVYSQDLASVTVGAWNEITLTTPFEVEFGVELWIGYAADDEGDGFFPCGCDAGPMVVGKGGWIRSAGGSWGELPETLDYNWNIQAYIEAPATGRPPTRDLTGYKVYRTVEPGVYEDDPIAEITDPNQTTYTDDAPIRFSMNYYVVNAVYDQGESPMGDEVVVLVLGPSAAVYSHDDGGAEGDEQPATGTFAATYFEGVVHPDTDHVTLRGAQIYFEDVADWDAIIKVWDNDGADGMPGTELTTFLFDNALITAGEWVYIPIDSIDINDASFYIGIQGVPSSPTLGVDEDNSGWSYSTSSGSWALVDGVYMIRAVVDRNTGTGEEDIPPAGVLAARNYPNPFNPETSILFNLPLAGQVDIKIYNVRGQLVKTLLSDTLEAGEHDVVWHGEDASGKACASGLYFYRVETANKSITQKMMLLK